MLNVFFTIDTEAYPLSQDWRSTSLHRDLERDIWGVTQSGDERGLRYQIQVFSQYGIKATFFIESLFASVPEIGAEPLRAIVAMAGQSGHDVQLHLHPEWLPYIPSLQHLPHWGLIRSFSESEQEQLIAHAKHNLIDAGAPNVCAFRAGDFAASFSTLRALGRNGFRFDSSYNALYLKSSCSLKTPDVLLAPRRFDDIWELPVTIYQDRPGHLRHLQFCACSFREMRKILEDAEAAGVWGVVLVSHSFELLANRRKRPDYLIAPRILVRRFELLCRFLAENRDRFKTVCMSDISEEDLKAAGIQLHGSAHHSLLRFGERALIEAELRVRYSSPNRLFARSVF